MSLQFFVQAQITAVTTLMCLSDDAGVLIDNDSSKDSHFAHLSLKSDVTLLTSGEASDPGMLGHNGKPSH